MIQRCIQLRLRLFALDEQFAATGTMSVHSSKLYLAWSNSFTRTLTALGKSVPQTPPQRAGRTGPVGSPAKPQHASLAALLARDGPFNAGDPPALATPRPT